MITVNGQTGEDKTLQFPVPEIKGYTGELEFDKKDSVNKLPIKGAKFKLKHADDLCGAGENTTCSSQNTLIEDITAVSDSEGRVKFVQLLRDIYTEYMKQKLGRDIHLWQQKVLKSEPL